MFCPKCKYEYVEGIEECADCGAKLVEELPLEEKKNYVFEDLVTVLVPSSQSITLIAKSLLEDAGIPYFAKNEDVQNLFALGQLGTGFNPLTGPVEIQVAQKYEEAARELLNELKE
ncbi:MAG: DUF2007 domain-containing protein [Halanaerobiales bacterium]|nr:DUF2007 domain-containing protein [Halanaerobiales bacterium]